MKKLFSMMLFMPLLSMGQGAGPALVIDDQASPFRVGSDEQYNFFSGYLASNGVVEFGVSADAAGIPYNGLLSADTMTMEQGGGIALFSEIGAMDLDLIYTNQLMASDTLILMTPDAVTNYNGSLTYSGLDLQNYIPLVQSNYLMQTMFFTQDGDLFVSFGRISLANSAGFEEGSDLWGAAEYIDAVGDGTDPRATLQLNLLNGMSGEEQNSELRQLYEAELPHHTHQRILLSGLDLVGGRRVSYRSARRELPDRSDPASDGAFGPRVQNQPIRPWAKAYLSHGSRIEDGDYDSYNHDLAGGVVGVDRGFGNWLFGVAGGMGMSRIKSSLNDKSTAQMGYAVLYSSWGAGDWAGHMMASYGIGDAATESGTAFDTEGDFKLDTAAAYVGLSREIRLKDSNTIITPEAGLGISVYRQDAYTETATTAVPRAIDSYEFVSLRPVIGTTFAWPYDDLHFRCEPRVRVFWTGELNSDVDTVDYSLVGSPEVYTLYIRDAVSNIYTIGAGAAFILENGWEFGADMDSHFGELSSLSLSIRAGYMF